MILFIALFLLFLCILFLLMLRKDYRVNTAENTIRIYFVFLVLVLLPLLVLFSIYAGKVEGAPFYTRLFKLIASAWQENRAHAICLTCMHAFLIFTGLSIPLNTIFHFCFGYKRFLHRYGAVSNCEGAETMLRLKMLFWDILNQAGLKPKVRFVLLDRTIEKHLPIFTECGIVGQTNKDVTLIMSKNFVNCFYEKKLSEDEVKAIFFHEISHIYNGDLAFPLWAKSVVSSQLFLASTVSCILALIFGLLSIGFSWENFILFVLFLPLSIYLFREGLLQIVGEAMREREHLADARAILLFTPPEALISAIKKVTILYKSSSSFSYSFYSPAGDFRVLDESYKFANFREFLRYCRWALYCFLTSKVYWHPLASQRIKVIEKREKSINESKVLLSPYIVLGISFLGGIIGFLTLMCASFLEVGKPQFTRLAIMLSFAISFLIVFISCLPLRTFSKMDFNNVLPPRRKHLPLHFFAGKFWRRTHANNLFIAEFNTLFLIFSGVTEMSYFHILWLFLACTGATILLVIIAYIIKH